MVSGATSSVESLHHYKDFPSHSNVMSNGSEAVKNLNSGKTASCPINPEPKATPTARRTPHPWSLSPWEGEREAPLLNFFTASDRLLRRTAIGNIWTCYVICMYLCAQI